MWKFTASKFKNAAPKIPKKNEWLSDVSANNLLNSCGNHIAASCTYMAFNIDAGGGSCIGLIPIEERGRREKSMPVLKAHADFVTDMNFNPFEDNLLATCSQDCTAKLWSLPENGLTDNLCNPVCTITTEERKIENVLWHPAAENILALTSWKTVKIFDVEAKQEKFVLDGCADLVQSVTWKGDGSLLATSSKDKKIRIFDPRANKVVQEAKGHANIKDSRAVWLGDKDQILTTGFDMMRSREVAVRDVRNLGSPLKTLTLDTSTGMLMPLYDADTNMVFLAGVGDTTIKYLEISEKEPYLLQNSVEYVEQVKGITLVPKRAMNVMEGEVNRVLLLSKDAIIPLPYHVPRKSYTEFHEDLFPETNSGKPSMTASEWLSGENKKVTKISLNPSGTPSKGATKTAVPHPSAGDIKNTMASCNISSPKDTPVKPALPSMPKPTLVSKPVQLKATPEKEAADNNTQDSNNSNTGAGEPVQPSVILRERKTKVFAGVRQSKFRHLNGKALHKSLHIDNIRNLSKTMPGESDAFHVNKERAAVPLAGPGGLLAILEFSKPGRLPDTGTPMIQNGSTLMDFAWDPFNNHRLVTACDDAKIRVWRIPKDGLTDTMTEPEEVLKGHTEKIYFVKFHPLANNILASGAYDMTVRIWDLETGEEEMQLLGHTDTIFAFAWSPDGKKCVTVCKDCKIRLYDPRKSQEPIKEGPGPQGVRGARAVWVCEGSYILVSGFDKAATRVLTIYDPSDLSVPIHKQDIDTSPPILIPHYDEDSNTLFLSGKGERTVIAYEVSEEKPYLFPLSTYKGEDLHQALSFLPKSEVDVKSVEFAKAYRLTKTSLEPTSFSVPRVKSELFQDDLFPDTKLTWIPTLSSKEWLTGVNRMQKSISLKPANMKLLSEAPKEAPKAKKYESYSQSTYKTDEQKKEELMSVWNSKIGADQDKPLPQDLDEGVDEDEWDD